MSIKQKQCLSNLQRILTVLSTSTERLHVLVWQGLLMRGGAMITSLKGKMGISAHTLRTESELGKVTFWTTTLRIPMVTLFGKFWEF